MENFFKCKTWLLNKPYVIARYWKMIGPLRQLIKFENRQIGKCAKITVFDIKRIKLSLSATLRFFAQIWNLSKMRKLRKSANRHVLEKKLENRVLNPPVSSGFTTWTRETDPLLSKFLKSIMRNEITLLRNTFSNWKNVKTWFTNAFGALKYELY